MRKLLTIGNGIGAILMVGVILFVVIKRYVVDSAKLDSDYRFAVATVQRISYPADGGPDADFQFCVNHVVYKNFTSFNAAKQKVSAGDQFLLKYYPPNPRIATIFLDQPLDSARISSMGLKTCEGN